MVDVKPIGAPSSTLLPDELPAVDVLLLPREISDGRGLYDDSVDTLAKEIRAIGVAADYQHDADSRAWIGEKHFTSLELDIIANVITSGGLGALVAVIRKRKSDRVRVKVARRSDTSSEVDDEWFEIEGPGAEVAEALKALERGATASKDDGEIE
jgi:hypothetical protein